MSEADCSGSFFDWWNRNAPPGYNLRMYLDYSPPALVQVVAGPARLVARPPEPTTRPASFAEVKGWADGFYRGIAERTTMWSSPRFKGSVTAYRHEYLTHSISESPNAAVECFLPAIVEPRVLSKYFLSPRAASGILKRAEKRGRVLPDGLRVQLEALAAAKTTPPEKGRSSRRPSRATAGSSPTGTQTT
jgi:hypothetical protein